VSIISVGNVHERKAANATAAAVAAKAKRHKISAEAKAAVEGMMAARTGGFVGNLE